MALLASRFDRKMGTETLRPGRCGPTRNLPLTMLKAITFDFWMTLYRQTKTAQKKRGRARRNLLAQFLATKGRGASMSDRRNAWDHANNLYDEWWRRFHRSLTTEQRLEVVLNHLDVRYRPNELRDLSRAYEDLTRMAPPRLIRGVRETVPRLAEQYRLAIICDTGITPGRVLRRILAQDGMLIYFSHCVFSDEVGRTKPHVDNFHLALRKLRARPEESVHIGDLIHTDILGAQDAGMHAVLFTGITKYSRRELQHEGRGVPVVSEFRQIPAVLESLKGAPTDQSSLDL
jgi:putative hydrolase of the HAD superfamily